MKADEPGIGIIGGAGRLAGVLAGTTAVAIEAMHASGFETAIARGLSAAFEKSVRLGEAP